MKKLTRAIVLVCIFATILSSVAFAVVLMPPRNQTYVVVPQNGHLISTPELPVRVSGSDTADSIAGAPLFSCVYTFDGSTAVETTGYTCISMEYNAPGDTGYIKGTNLVPATKIRVVDVQSAKYYKEIIIDSNKEGKPNVATPMGELPKGSLVKYVSTYSYDWWSVTVYVRGTTAYKVCNYYINRNDLKTF